MKKLNNINSLFIITILIFSIISYMNVLKTKDYELQINNLEKDKNEYLSFIFNDNYLKMKEYKLHLNKELSEEEKLNLTKEKFKNQIHYIYGKKNYNSQSHILKEVDYSDSDISCDTLIEEYIKVMKMFPGIKITNNKCTEEENEKIKKINFLNELKNRKNEDFQYTKKIDEKKQNEEFNLIKEDFFKKGIK